MSTIAPDSLKSDAGIAKLNELLSQQSFVGGNSQATAEDIACFSKVTSVPDKAKFPHAARWYKHILALRAERASYYEWPASSSKKAPPPKSNKTLEVDVQPFAWTGPTTVPSTSAPPLGAGSRCVKRKSGKLEGKYYITTAINYANGWPHMGHAYEALTSDVFARYHRLTGKDVYFMTGSDEHGQKIAEKAEAEGMTPLASCDRYAAGFQALNQRLLCSNDFYIRTTQPLHEAYAKEMWKKMKSTGDIYLANYEGWYCVREEKYFTETEAQESNYKDPDSGAPLEKRSEPSFFFKLSKFADQVLKHIEANEDFVQPQQYRGEILERLRSIEMRDLSISRGTFTWGVPCPEDKVDGSQHVMYVWFEALINYTSGVYAGDSSKELSRFWPADAHVIGKDISWFHSVIWPAMLMSCNLPLPKSVVVHGFIGGSDGRKMSKSYGNVVDPHEELGVVAADTFRWYLCRESPYGDDLKYSMDSMKLMHNADLCDNLGNLVNRAVTLCGGSIPDFKKGLVELPFDLKELKKATAEAYAGFRLSEAADLAVVAAKATNKWIADLEPWKMKDESKQVLRAATLRILVEAVYVLAHFFAPFLPTAAEAIFKKLNVEATAIPDLADDFLNLKTGAPVTSSSVLFQVLDLKASVAKAPAPSPTPSAPAAKGAETKKTEAKAQAAPKEKAKEKPAPAAAQDSGDQPTFSKLDIRVGKVVDAWHHPEADRLFVEMIDVGDPEGPRQIVSGLREHYKLEEFKGMKLLAVCNMKPSKLVKVDSYGMVLCAKDGNKVELLAVPDSLEVGTRVLPEGTPATWEPFKPKAVKEKKVWESVAEKLRTDENRVAKFDGVPLATQCGVKFLAPTLPNSIIS